MVMTVHNALNMVRNPFGFEEEGLREARLRVADEVESLQRSLVSANLKIEDLALQLAVFLQDPATPIERTQAYRQWMRDRQAVTELQAAVRKLTTKTALSEGACRIDMAMGGWNATLEIPSNTLNRTVGLTPSQVVARTAEMMFEARQKDEVKS